MPQKTPAGVGCQSNGMLVEVCNKNLLPCEGKDGLEQHGLGGFAHLRILVQA
jgi:hypothetical protein